MNRTDYAFQPLSEAQYDALITAGSMGGTSPIHGTENYQAFLAACQSINCDPRVLLAGLLFEDHFGCDPNGAAAASVKNLSGIKWAEQANAYDSGVVSTEGDNYAGFRTFGDFFQEYARTLTNGIIGPSFAAGDLAGAWAIYVGGPRKPNAAAGAARVQQWQFYVARYPASVGAVTGANVIAKARQYIGQPATDGSLDGNGPHPWAFWCEAFAESIPRSLGLTIPRMANAVSHGRSLALHSGTPVNGAWVFFDERFFNPDGHVGFWDAEQGQLLRTLTDGTGVGYRDWGPQTVGFMGWALPDGVLADPAPDDFLHLNGHLIGGAFMRLYTSTPYSLQAFGLPLDDEHQAAVTDPAPDGVDAHAVTKTRTVQTFERAVFVFQPELPPPWDVVVMPLASSAASGEVMPV